MSVAVHQSPVTPASRRKRVLIVAYYFPPIGTSGTFRTLKFVKYLPQFGWDPIVLTVDARHEYIEPKNEALLSQLPASVTVVRTYAWSLQKLLHRAQKTENSANLTKDVISNKKPSFSQKVRAFVRDIFHFPDGRSGWFPFALVRGFIAVRKLNVDVIYTSAPPYTGTLVGLGLKLLTGKPLISDFRDPWVGNTYRYQPDQQQVTWQARWAKALEQKTFAHSARVINVSADLTAKSQSVVPPESRSKFLTIHNGFDADDFTPLPPRVADGKFRIVYTGCFYEGSREPKNFLRALRLLADQSPLEFEKIEVWFVGDMVWAAANAPWCNSLKLGEHIQFKPFLPHKENLKLLAESDLLLMIGSVKPADTGSLPVKIFEYAATRRPMLALVHEGESAKFVRGCGIGRLANPENPEEIATTLLEMYREIRAGTFPTEPNLEFLRQYDRRELTRQLAELFTAVTPAPS